MENLYAYSNLCDEIDQILAANNYETALVRFSKELREIRDSYDDLEKTTLLVNTICDYLDHYECEPEKKDFIKVISNKIKLMLNEK